MAGRQRPAGVDRADATVTAAAEVRMVVVDGVRYRLEDARRLGLAERLAQQEREAEQAAAAEAARKVAEAEKAEAEKAAAAANDKSRTSARNKAQTPEGS